MIYIPFLSMLSVGLFDVPEAASTVEDNRNLKEEGI